MILHDFFFFPFICLSGGVAFTCIKELSIFLILLFEKILLICFNLSSVVGKEVVLGVFLRDCIFKIIHVLL